MKGLILSLLLGFSMSLNILLTISSISSTEIRKIQNQNTVITKAKIKSALNNAAIESITSLVNPLNKFNYSYLINTNNNYCGKDNGKNLLFIAFVPVSPNSFEIRDLIRSTWANDKYLKLKAKVIFLIGKSNESVVNLQIKNESLKYSDIVQNDFMDTYYNLTIKTIMGFKWVSSFCQNAQYTLKIDDDVVVNVPFFIDYLEELVRKNKHQKNSLIGRFFKKAKVIRNSKSKFYVPRNEFENDFYNEYCEGPAYLLTNDLVVKMYEKSLNTKMIKFEDIYVGILAKSLNATFINLNKNFRYYKWRNKIIYLKEDKRLNQKFFIYSSSLETFKDIWNYLVKNRDL